MQPTPLASAPPPGRPVALVTGGAHRIGRAIVLTLAEAGWDIALHCRNSRAEAEITAAQAGAMGASAEIFQANLADAADCEALVPAVLLRCGRLDAVINNASLFEYDDVASFTVSAMDHHWRANTAPAILLARALHEHLVGRGRGARGCVVNLLDQKLANPNPDYLSYSLSKAALEAATTMLAQALAPVLRVCGVSPGLVLQSDLIDATRLQALQRETPLGLGVHESDVAKAVLFLLTSPVTTGINLLIDAGSHLAPATRDFAFQKALHG